MSACAAFCFRNSRAEKKRQAAPARLSLRAFLAVIGVFSISFAIHAQSPAAAGRGSNVPVSPSSRLPPVKEFAQYAPYWTDEAGWHSELQLRNNIANQSLTVTPVLRGPDGTEFPLAPVTIQPNEIKSVDLTDAVINQAPQLMGLYGSVAIRYTSRTMRSLYAAVMVYDGGRPIAFHMDAFTLATDFSAGSREGIWWLPNQSAKDLLVLTNNGVEPLPVTLTVFDAKGKGVAQEITLPPKAVIRDSIRTIVQKAGLTGSYGGFRIDVSARVGSLDTAYFLYDETAGFGALMKTFDRNPQAKLEQRPGSGDAAGWTTRAPMLALSNPDPGLGFPAGTALQPTLFIRNTTGVQTAAALRFNWTSESTTGSSVGPVLTLKPFETRLVDVSSLQQSGAIPAEAHWATVEITTPGRPNDIMATAASYDKTLRYGAQTPFNDQLSYLWEGGEWMVDGDHNSIITTGNGGNADLKAQISILYDSGTKQYDIEQALKPHEQAWVNVGELIHDQVPDINGKLLPAYVMTGSYQIRDLTDRFIGNLYEGKVIVDKTYGHATYGCSTCCGYGSDPWMYYDPIDVATGLTEGQDVWDTDYCTMEQVSILDVIGPSTWGTGNSAIATASRAQITGVGVGSTTNSASGSLETGGLESKHCSVQTVYPSGPENTTPSITGISPALGLVGTQISVTISGTNFATGATVSAGSNITVSNVVVNSDTQITANFTPANSKSAGGNQGVTVTVPGSPASNSKNFFVQYPLHIVYTQVAGKTGTNGHSMTVTGDDINVVSVNGTTYATDVCGGYQWLTYALTDQAGNTIVNGNVNWSESFSNDSPANDPLAPTAGPPLTVNNATSVLSDTYALWVDPPPCLPVGASDSFNQTWTPNVGGTITGGIISGGVTYSLSTVILASQSVDTLGYPSFNVSITTP